MAFAAAAAPREEFLTGARLKMWCRVFGGVWLCAGLGFIVWGLWLGGIDPNGKPLGTDFASFYAASTLALAGHPEQAYDIASHYAAQTAIFARDIGYSAFFYPPVFLLYCLPFAMLPYLWSLLAWQGATLLLYWRVARRFAGEQPLGALPIFAFPAVIVTLGHGQNAFLSTGLFGLATLCQRSRPLLAGVCFGALVYKPQLGIVIPFALVAAGRWRTLFSAAATVAALALASAAVFGLDTWRAFLAGMPLAQSALEQDLVGFYKMQSSFAAVRVLGGGAALASAIQGLATLAAIAVVIAVRRRKSDPQMPIEATAALLASPFLLDYDLTLLALPLCFLFREGLRSGFRPHEKLACVAAFALPAFSRELAYQLHLPLAPLVVAAVLALLARRALEAPAAR